MKLRLLTVAAGFAALALLLAATPAPPAAQLPEDQGFAVGHEKFARGDHGGACRDLTGFLLKATDPTLVRQARVERALSCGSDPRARRDLREVAGSGPNDWHRALALLRLLDWGDRAMGGDPNGRAKLALEILQAMAREKGPLAATARSRAFSLGLGEISTGRLPPEATSEQLQQLDLSQQERESLAYERAVRLLALPARQAQGEKELWALVDAKGTRADSAALVLGQAAERAGKLVRAVEIYQRAPDSASARAQIERIQAPGLELQVKYVELPGTRPEASLGFRNVSEATFTLYRLDPSAVVLKTYFEEGAEKGLVRGGVVRTWKERLPATDTYAPGQHGLSFDSPGPGLFLLEARAGSVASSAVLHVTPYVAVVKSAPREIVTWLSDAMTGQAAGAGRAVVLLSFTEEEGGTRYSKVEGACDASGLCRIPIPPRPSGIEVWTGKGGAWTVTDIGGVYWEQPASEALAYVLTDRPLYRPGEKVGVKVFFRTRGSGPVRPLTGRSFKIVTTDANGEPVDERVVRPNAFGTVSFEVPLKKDAALGAWEVTVDNPREEDEREVVQGAGDFQVEEYKPPEYFVTVEPVGSPKPGESVRVKVQASLYSGGPIAGASGRAVVTPRHWSHEFGAWPGEEELSQGRGLASLSDYGGRPGWAGLGGPRQRPLPKTPCFQWGARTLAFVTDDEGNAELEVEPACPSAPVHAVDVQVYVMDLSRREVEGQGSVVVDSTPYYADLKTDHFLYRPGEQVRVQVRAEDGNGRPASPELWVRLVRVDEKAESEVLRRDVVLKDGKADVSLDADALGPVRVELRAKGEDPKEVGAMAEADLWLTSDSRPLIPPWGGLFVVTDNRPVTAGGKLRALVVTGRPGGHALVTLEGDRVYQAQAVELKGRARFLELPITGEMTPAASLAVWRIERLEQQSWDSEVVVSGSELPLQVKVGASQESALPGTNLPVEVKLEGAPAGMAAEVAFSAVDESLFAIAPEKTDLVTFFARSGEGNRVLTESSLGNMAFRPLPPEPKPPVDSGLDRPAYLEANAPMRGVSGVGSLGASGGMGGAGHGAAKAATAERAERAEDKRKDAAPSMARPALSVAAGPQGSAAPPPIRVRSRFSSSAGWSPALAGSLGGSVRPTARFSDSLTRWKLTAYAVTAAGHLGVGSTSVRTEQPVMVRLQAPRFFTERDEVVLSAIVSSRLARPTQVEVALDAPGLEPIGPARRTVTVQPNRDLRVDARFRVAAIGTQRIRAIARAGAAGDAMEWTLPAVLHGAPVRTAFTGKLQERFGFDVELPEKRNPRGTQLALTLSPSLLGVMLDALPYLADFPYGCVEQTLSRFVPAVAAARVVHGLGVPSARVPKDLDAMVDAGLKRLYGFQHADGGWGWWEKDETDPRMTAYVVYGLGLARSAGVKVDPAVLERGRGWLQRAADQAQSADWYGYAAFAMASSGEASKKLLDHAVARQGEMKEREKAFTALALLSAKDPRGKAALAGLEPLVEVLRLALEKGRVDEVWDSCAGVELVALTLMAFGRSDPQDPRVKTLTDFLVLRRKGDRWASTQDTAFAIYALSDLAMMARGRLADGSVKVLVNGKVAMQAAYKSGGAEAKTLVLPDTAFKKGRNRVEVEHRGAQDGHWAALFDVVDVDENAKGRPSPAVEVRRSYTILGRPGAEQGAAPMEYGMALEAGERVRVELQVKVLKPMEYVIIEDKRPAGLVTVSQRSGTEFCNWACTHAELRPDRVAYFARALKPGTYSMAYELRAEVPGRFHGLPTQVQAMYAPEILATSDEVRVEVRDAVGSTGGTAGK